MKIAVSDMHGILAIVYSGKLEGAFDQEFDGIYL